MRQNKVVYLHKKAGTDEVVYVGIGSPSRPFDFERRSDFWKKTHDKYGIDVEVIHTDLTWDEACEIEIELIAHYGRRDLGTGCLVNMTDGGDGINGYNHTEQHKKGMKGPKNPNWKENKSVRPKGGWPKCRLRREKYKWVTNAPHKNRRKLSDDDIVTIREQYVPRSKDANAAVFAKRYGVTRQAILKILKGNTYHN